MKYKLAIGSALWIFFQATISMAAGLENNVDRPGGDGYGIPNIDQPSQCQRLCNQEGRCRSFTWVRPGLQGPRGRCWLKFVVPRAVRNKCCVSGLKNVQSSRQCKWFQRTSSYECKCFNAQRRQWILSNPGYCPKVKPPVKYIDPKKHDDRPPGSCVFGQC